MVAIRHNEPSALTVNYVNPDGAIATITLGPGINLGVDERQWEAIAAHPVVKALLESGTLEPLVRDPQAQGELAGFEVVEDKASGQPMPIQGATDGIKPQAIALPPRDPESPSLAQGVANPSLDGVEPTKKPRSKRSTQET